MLGSLLRRLTGQRTEPPRPAPIPPAVAEPQADAAPPAEQPAEPDLQMSSLEAHALPGGPGKSPVFSSRAVRDATVVTGTIESLNRFVTGQDVLDDLTWRLESLTADQVNFLQLSAEPGLIQRAQARSEILKGAKAAALRKLLTDLAGGAIPEPASRGAPLVPPNAPILPPLTSLLPRAGEVSVPPVPSLGSANPAPPGPGAPSLTTAPPLVSKPIPPAPAKPLVPAPLPPKAPVVSAPALAEMKTEPKPVETRPVEVKAPEAKAPEPKPAAIKLPDIKPLEPKPAEPPPAAKAPEPVVAAPKTPTPASHPAPAPVEPPRPEPAKVQAEPMRPAQAPVAPPPEPAGLPRLGRQDAEARRARLLASLNDTFSSSEAAP